MKSTPTVLTLVLVLVLVWAKGPDHGNSDGHDHDQVQAHGHGHGKDDGHDHGQVQDHGHAHSQGHGNGNHSHDHDNHSTDPECEGLKKTIDPHKRNMVEGTWTMVWGVSDGPTGQALIPIITSSQITLHWLDNTTLSYKENNFYRAEKSNCSFYDLNATVVDGHDEHDFKLESHGGILDYEGKEGPFHDNVTISFYQCCEHCLGMIFASKLWDNFFLAYEPEGHLTDAKSKEKSYLKCAECLGFPTEPAFVYDGISEFCHVTPH